MAHVGHHADNIDKLYSTLVGWFFRGHQPKHSTKLNCSLRLNKQRR